MQCMQQSPASPLAGGGIYKYDFPRHRNSEKWRNNDAKTSPPTLIQESSSTATTTRYLKANSSFHGTTTLLAQDIGKCLSLGPLILHGGRVAAVLLLQRAFIWYCRCCCSWSCFWHVIVWDHKNIMNIMFYERGSFPALVRMLPCPLPRARLYYLCV